MAGERMLPCLILVSIGKQVSPPRRYDGGGYEMGVKGYHGHSAGAITQG